MAKINILSPFVADLIAAGEVVERPASVVKELLENAVDAGARNVTLELRGGGREYIRVTDDGCGMSPEDAGIAFLRHATSKLSDARGLEAIGTLGFRGEALAAISSVSHIELSSRERGAQLGVRMKLDAGEISDMYETGCPEGTTMIVRGLFYNTPARLKFMKTDRAEGTACVQAALRSALGRPDVSFRCIKDGREEFFTPGDGRKDSAVYALLGRELAAAMLKVELEDGPVRVSGCVSAPSMARGSRAAQFFFCNGRPIRSQLLQAALEQAYRGTLLTGRFPACALYIDLAPAAVDVNVHPAKTEVKFSDDRRVFDALYYATRGALEAPQPPEKAGEGATNGPGAEHIPAAGRQHTSFGPSAQPDSAGGHPAGNGPNGAYANHPGPAAGFGPNSQPDSAGGHPAGNGPNGAYANHPGPAAGFGPNSQPGPAGGAYANQPAAAPGHPAGFGNNGNYAAQPAHNGAYANQPSATGGQYANFGPNAQPGAAGGDYANQPGPAEGQYANFGSNGNCAAQPDSAAGRPGGYAPAPEPPAEPAARITPLPHGQDAPRDYRGCPPPEPSILTFRADAAGPAQEGPPAPREEPMFGSEPPRVIGEALELYVLVQQGDTLIIIDKHAAHERMIYDRLRQREAEVMSQVLLEPAPYRPDRAAAGALEEELELINSLGFELEPFGEGAFMLRAAPEGLDAAEALAALDELASALLSSRRPDKNAARDELLKTVACKAAIKAGRSSAREELQTLAEAVCSGRVRYCPHGRPVSWPLTRRDLDKQFKRIV